MDPRWFGAAALLAGCASSAGGAAKGGGGPDAATLSVSMELTVAAATELHQCRLVQLPTDTDVDVVGIAHEYSRGSHHFVVFQTDLDSIPSDLAGQYDCVRGDEPIMQHTRGILYGAQSPSGSVAFPEGVGLHLGAGQVFLMQVHYLNTSSEPIDAKATLSFVAAPAGSVRTHAGFMTFYDPFIYLPPESAATSGIRCAVPEDITLLTASTHYHQRGAGMTVWIDPDSTTPADAPFFETHDWEHSHDFVGPKEVTGGSVVRMRCDYANPDPVEVFQGPNAATSEMCVLGSVYYPQLGGGFESCDPMSVEGTGSQTCLALADCVKACPATDGPQRTHGGVNVGPCWERCVASGCDGATDALLPLVSCVGSKCQGGCSDPAACAACAATQCALQLQACSANSCSK